MVAASSGPRGDQAQRDGFGVSAASMHLIPALSRNTEAMPGSNAGIKRNRRPTGTKPFRIDARISAEAYEALDAARQASGNLSMGLYLEQLTAALRQQDGKLPVLSPTLEHLEVQVSAA